MYYTNFVSSPEGYFQTVICNVPEFAKTAVNHDLHYISWDIPPQQHPHTLSLNDTTKMITSSAAFARKFKQDDPVLDKIDKDILRRKNGSFTPGGWCSGKPKCSEVGNLSKLKPGPGAQRLRHLVARLAVTAKFGQNQCVQVLWNSLACKWGKDLKERRYKTKKGLSTIQTEVTEIPTEMKNFMPLLQPQPHSCQTGQHVSVVMSIAINCCDSADTRSSFLWQVLITLNNYTYSLLNFSKVFFPYFFVTLLIFWPAKIQIFHCSRLQNFFICNFYLTMIDFLTQLFVFQGQKQNFFWWVGKLDSLLGLDHITNLACQRIYQEKCRLAHGELVMKGRCGESLNSPPSKVEPQLVLYPATGMVAKKQVRNDDCYDCGPLSIVVHRDFIICSFIHQISWD